MGGRDRNKAERSRGTAKNNRCADAGGGGDDDDFLLAGVVHAGFRGAGGHSVGVRSLLSSDVGVVGSASSSASGGRGFASGAVDGEADLGSGAATAATVVLIGGSGRRTSPAATGELIWRGEFLGLLVGIKGESLSAREEKRRWKFRLGWS